MTETPPSERTRLKRASQRGHYDRETIDTILDAGLVCHVGHVVDGAPVVTPTSYWREGDHVYWHGSSASRMIRCAEGSQVCLSVAHIDGLVLARSGFHHSANYRSVMLFGTAVKVTDEAEKRARLDAFIDGMFPGRCAELRPVNDQELKATTVLSIAIDEVSAKVRSGPPADDEADYALPVWAGVLPIRMVVGEPQPCPRLDAATPLPANVGDFKLD